MPVTDHKSILRICIDTVPSVGVDTVYIDVGSPTPIIPSVTFPQPRASVDEIHILSGFEKLDQGPGLALLRECRRLLKIGGRLKIATVDLAKLVDITDTSIWNAQWAAAGYDWEASLCEKINYTSPDLPGKYLYYHDALIEAAKKCGLTCIKSIYTDKEMIVDFQKKPSHVASGSTSLVSVLIPSHKAQYFEQALRSAMEQTWPNLEIIIGDDCPTDAVEKIVRKYAPDDPRINYIHNSPGLGSAANFIDTLQRAKGMYIKYLNDDDYLAPDCISQMVRCLERNPDAILVTSHRQLINENGDLFMDIPATRRPVEVDSYLDGSTSVNAIVANSLNFIGEPTTPLFRKSDIMDAQPTMFHFGGYQSQVTGDVCMWINLLQKGDLIYIADTLSYFRQHDDQFGKLPGNHELGMKDWQYFERATVRLGLANEAWPRTLKGSKINLQARWPDEMLAILSKTEAALQAGQWEQVEESLNEANRLVPKDPWILLTMGTAAMELGKLDSARSHFEMLVTTKPDYMDGYIGLARLEMEAPDMKKAEEVLQFALKRQPQHVAPLSFLAQLYLEAGQHKKAAESCAKALQTDPTHVASLIILGEVYFKLGAMEKAQQYTLRGLAREPDNVKGLANLKTIQAAISGP